MSVNRLDVMLALLDDDPEIEQARAELAQLRADLTQAQARIAELTTERDAARAELASNKVYQRMAARR